ncbi:MAG: DNA recombination protein RmuC [Candidatus Aceula meridiana]|nr:DNA recombination protein RmuC [Candidatus Aceula meridiana]
MSVSVLIILVGLAVLLGFVIMLFVQKELLKKEIRTEFDFSRKQLEEKSTSELDERKRSVEHSLKDLKDELNKYGQMVREFEKDRAEKYGNLSNELKSASQATSKLQETTNHLTSILGNVKKRGEWGERMAEDIIQLCGLIEGKNYKKQKKMDSSTSKPDYTFFLPNEHKINMDVKFPLNSYLNMVNAPDAAQKDMYKKTFITDARNRVKEIQNRDYINPGEGTLDFVLLFIPNEQVYGFIQENDASIMDEALLKKVVLCSPFTLYAMLSIIRQAFENFHYENSIKKIIETINLFSKEYDRFKDRFQGLGDAIKKTGSTYDDINDKNFKRLDAHIKKIEGHKKGNLSSLEEKEVIDFVPEPKQKEFPNKV